MRKFLGVSLTIALGVTALIASPASADSPNAALHVSDDDCDVFDGSGLVQFDLVPWKSVENNNTEVEVCKGSVDPAPEQTVHYDQDSNPSGAFAFYFCANGTESTSWRQTITPSGRTSVKITCPTSRV